MKIGRRSPSKGVKMTRAQRQRQQIQAECESRAASNLLCKLPAAQQEASTGGEALARSLESIHLPPCSPLALSWLNFAVWLKSGIAELPAFACCELSRKGSGKSGCSKNAVALKFVITCSWKSEDALFSQRYAPSAQEGIEAARSSLVVLLSRSRVDMGWLVMWNLPSKKISWVSAYPHKLRGPLPPFFASSFGLTRMLRG